MKSKHLQCINCCSTRRPIKACQLCAKCYYWTRQLMDFTVKLEAFAKLPKEEQGSKCVSLRFRTRIARKALEELKWREEGLNADDISDWKLRSMVCALARDCGSTVEEASLQEFESIEPATRRKIYQVLLEIIETLPHKWPSLHTGIRPDKNFRGFRGGWSDWLSQCRLREANSDS